jgi:hypothetical protein
MHSLTVFKLSDEKEMFATKKMSYSSYVVTMPLNAHDMNEADLPRMAGHDLCDGVGMRE